MELTTLTPSSSRAPGLMQAVESYIKYYASEAHNATHVAKRRDLMLLLGHVAKREHLPAQKLPLKTLTHSALQQFVDDRLAAGYAARTVARELQSVKHFCSRLAELIPGWVNPGREVKAPSRVESRTEYLEPVEQEEILGKAAVKWWRFGKFTDHQIYTIILMMLQTGLRLDEVRSVRMSQIDGEWIRNLKCKGRKYRDVYLSARLRKALAVFFRARHQLLVSVAPHYDPKVHSDLPVFVSQWRANILAPETWRLGPTTIWQRLQQIDERLHPHLFRHSFARHMVNVTGDVALVAQALGHSDVKITMRYTERTDKQLAAAIESMAG